MPRPRSDISERVLHAAARRFLEDGVDGAAMRAIARDAGTSVGMVTYYFPTKDALFAAVVEHAYKGLLDDLGQALAPGVPFETQVARLHQRASALTEEEFVVIRLVVRELLVSSPRAPALLARFSRGHIPMLLEAVGRAYAQGEVRPEVHPLATVLAVAATGLGVHVAARLLSEAFPAAAMPPEASGLGPSLRDLLFHGLSPAPADTSVPHPAGPRTDAPPTDV